MLHLKTLSIIINKEQLSELPDGKVLINTINAFSYNNAQKDELFAEALTKCDAVVPDGASIVMACRWIKANCQPEERIAGWDLFVFEMNRLEERAKEQGKRLKVMFMGSSENVLTLIRERALKDYPHLDVITYSPPYKAAFSEEDDANIINAINTANPDLLWVGMTAPKQEKWTYQHWQDLDIHCHVGTIGAVFDFYAGTVKRAPRWWQEHSLEWCYRLLKEPRRMWRRYIVGNIEFLIRVLFINR